MIVFVGALYGATVTAQGSSRAQAAVDAFGQNSTGTNMEGFFAWTVPLDYTVSFFSAAESKEPRSV